MLSRILILLVLPIILMGCYGKAVDESASTDLKRKHKIIENKFTVSSSAAGWYTLGEKITIRIRHPFKISVTGAPRIPVTLSSGTRNANYISGSGSSILLFQYTVVASDLDDDGIEVGDVDLNGGSMTFTYKGVIENAETALDALEEVLN